VGVDKLGHVKVSVLRKVMLGYSVLAVHWLNSWTLALLDLSEKLHVLDVHSEEEMESCDLSRVGLIYESSHFKGIFTGGNVSKAMVNN